jgi:hypothetical protein
MTKFFPPRLHRAFRAPPGAAMYQKRTKGLRIMKAR